jgi:hypothetical protein
MYAGMIKYYAFCI